MVPAELVLAALLVGVLLGLAGFYSWQQVRTLRALRADSGSADDRSYLRRRAWRRLIGCALMVLLAALVVGLYAIQAQLDAAPQDAPDRAHLRREQLAWIRWYSACVVVLAVVFFVLVWLALRDMMATRRYTVGQLRRLQSEHDAELRTQAARLRRERDNRP